MNKKVVRVNSQLINVYYVVDFDRCLADVDASYGILSNVVHNLGIISQRDLLKARTKVEAYGESFSVLQYIKNFKPDVDFSLIETEYKKQASIKRDSLLEPGAKEFIDYLQSSGAFFCIMSFGDKDWQTLKIYAAGFMGVPIQIVDSKYKGQVITTWRNKETQHFDIPARLFTDNQARFAKEVVLIDDKATAFESLPPNARGYHVNNPNKSYAFQAGVLPASVKVVKQIDDIIDLEKAKYS